jgi:MATE family multidrug resistance protein
MIILDQLVLARFSMNAMTGVASATVWCSALQFSITTTTMIASAFVGQYNGAKKFRLAGTPVWQMVWFSLSLFVFSIPFSKIAGRYCIPPALYQYGLPYFETIICFTPICGICQALSGFFVAIGRGILVTASILVANVVNVVLDIILVFGYFGIDGFTGTRGAAIGSVIAWFVNCCILSLFFFKRNIREKYGTIDCKFHFYELARYLKLGATGGVGHVCEMLAWGFLYYTLATIGTDIAMIQSIAVSVNVFLAFVVSGLEKGVMSITANLLGAGIRHKTFALMKKGITIHLSFTAIVSTLFLFAPEIITQNFIKFEIDESLVQETHLILKFVLLYFMIDGICWIIAGILEAGGDLGFTMGTIALCIWFIVTIPSFILAKLGHLNIRLTWSLLILAVSTISYVLYGRFKSGKWMHIKV